MPATKEPAEMKVLAKNLGPFHPVLHLGPEIWGSLETWPLSYQSAKEKCSLTLYLGLLYKLS